jgi:hypothetical protein
MILIPAARNFGLSLAHYASEIALKSLADGHCPLVAR